MNHNHSKPRRILVVEDEATSAETLGLALEGMAATEISFAGGAEEALERLGAGAYHLLITDIQLPRMTGLDLLSALRASSNGAVLPVLVVSGDADPQTPARALALGARRLSPSRIRPRPCAGWWRSCSMTDRLWLAALLFCAAPLGAQQQPDLNAILARLEALEQQNRELKAELQALRKQVTPEPAKAVLAERVEVLERRSEETAQTKVESDHKLPIQLTGMALFNAYWNGGHSGDTSHPTTASLALSQPFAGATLRQSIFGVKFQGPHIFAGGTVNGTLYVDFFAGTATSLNQLARIRTASIDLDWRDTTITVGQDKPILAPREPTSLAQVGVTPLTAAGNLWLWMPQARIERRFHFGDSAGLRAQFGVFQTNESTANVPAEYVSMLSRARPGWQGRWEFWRDFAGDRHVSIAPGVHYSRSRFEGYTLRRASMRWTGSSARSAGSISAGSSSSAGIRRRWAACVLAHLLFRRQRARRAQPRRLGAVDVPRQLAHDLQSLRGRRGPSGRRPAARRDSAQPRLGRQHHVQTGLKHRGVFRGLPGAHDISRHGHATGSPL